VQAPAAEALPGRGQIRSIVVTGNQRLETETVISYMKLRIGETYTPERGDEALKDLFATELFADVAIRYTDGRRRGGNPREPGDQPHRSRRQ
jgi:outer membrane protein insertion porin family